MTFSLFGWGSAPVSCEPASCDTGSSWGLTSIFTSAVEECVEWTSTIVHATINCTVDVLTCESDIVTEAFEFCETAVNATVDCTEDFLHTVVDAAGCDVDLGGGCDTGCNTGCDVPHEPAPCDTGCNADYAVNDCFDFSAWC